MTSFKQNKSALSKKSRIDEACTHNKNPSTRASFKAVNNLKQPTNTQEAIHLETIGLIEDRLFKKLSLERK